MRIIHGHDYYDSALAFGQDDKVILVREKSNVLTKDQIRSIPHLYEPHGSLVAGCAAWKNPLEFVQYSRIVGKATIVARTCKVWIAGSEWNGVCLDVYNASDFKRTYAWSWQSLISWGNSHGVEFPIRSKTDGWSGRSYINPNWFGEKTSHADLISWMIAKRASIITLDPGVNTGWYVENTWRINGDNLRTMEFYRAVDAFSLFQRVSQWVGGVLSVTTNQTLEIKDDLIKAHKHGFDKWSFRKPPQEKIR